MKTGFRLTPDRGTHQAAVNARLASGFYDEPCIAAVAVHDMVKSGDMWTVAEPADLATRVAGEQDAAHVEAEEPPHCPRTWGEPGEAEADVRVIPAPGAREEERDGERFQSDFEIQNH